MVAKNQPFPDRRRLSSGPSGALKSDGRRRKKEPAALLTATRFYSYNTHLSATAVPALRAGRRRLVSGGNPASGATQVRVERGVRFQAGTVSFCGESMFVVTTLRFRGPRQREVLQILSGEAVSGRCKRRPYLSSQNAGMNTLFIFSD